jgi:hypothetical protein
VVDAEDVLLAEAVLNDLIQLLGGIQVATEWLFNDDTGTMGAAGEAKLLHDLGEEAGRDGKVVDGVLGVAELLADLVEGVDVVVVAVDVSEALHEDGIADGVDPSVRLKALAGVDLELVEVPAGLSDADDAHVELAAFGEALKRREDLLVGEIARGPEEDKCVRCDLIHEKPSSPMMARRREAAVP